MRFNHRASRDPGEPIAKPACTITVQFVFLIGPSSGMTLFFWYFLIPFSEEDTIKALLAAYAGALEITEGNLLPEDCVLPVCFSFLMDRSDLFFQRGTACVSSFLFH
jgi:hypothetical protein